MTEGLFLQLFINGFASGMVYVLVASGLILVLGVARIFNFAHGEFYMLGAYGTFALCQVFHVNYFLSIFVTLLAVAGFAAWAGIIWSAAACSGAMPAAGC